MSDLCGGKARVPEGGCEEAEEPDGKEDPAEEEGDKGSEDEVEDREAESAKGEGDDEAKGETPVRADGYFGDTIRVVCEETG